jgi:hypothetical protein
MLLLVFGGQGGNDYRIKGNKELLELVNIILA